MAHDDRLAGWKHLKRILVAADGSDACADAVALAVEFASKHDAELTFVHVVPTVDLAPSGAVNDVGAALPHTPTEHDHAVLQDAKAAAAERGVAAATVLLGGSTVDQIVAHADAVDADLVIVGTSGHGAIAKALLGSVSLGVLRRSTRPVLIVRGARHGHEHDDAAHVETSA